MEEKMESVNEKIIERMKMRTDNIAMKAEQRREEKKKTEADSENIDYFYDTFQSMKDDIEKKVKQTENVERNQVIAYLDNLVKDVQKMQQFLNESSMFLASFQIKKAQENVGEINDLVQNRIDELQPQKKFGFGKKKGEKKDRSKELKDNTDSGLKMKMSISLNEIIEKQFFGFKYMSGETLTKSSSELENRQLNLQGLKDCKVIALGNPSTLQVANLTDCVVIVGPTSRSAFIKDCTNCKFMMACQQVRIHNTQKTQFYLHVTGSAIIENCKEVQFAPYSIRYPELSEHYLQSGLDLATNNWDKIEDFHWLNENEDSPNWSVIPESDRIKNWL